MFADLSVYTFAALGVRGFGAAGDARVMKLVI
jgi:hypothetical protein